MSTGRKDPGCPALIGRVASSPANPHDLKMSISSSEAKHDEEKAVDATVDVDVVPVISADDGVKRQGGVIGKVCCFFASC